MNTGADVKYVVKCRLVSVFPNGGPNLKKRECTLCKCAVWVAPATFEFMASRPAAEPWAICCDPCAEPIMEASEQMTVIIGKGEL